MRARRAMSDDSVPRGAGLARPAQPAPLRRLPRARRRSSVLFVGVAASSAFQDARDVELGVGQTAKVGGYEITYVKPTRRPAGGQQRPAREDRPRRGDARLARRRARSARCAPSARSSPRRTPSLGPISRFFEGEATSEVGLRAGLRRDVWTAISPERARPAARGSRRATRCSPAPSDDLDGRAARDRRSAQALDGLTRSYAANPPPATFRLIVSPLVSWIWIGALIVFLGGLIALWPPARRAPRPVAARYAARVAQELGRA